MTIEQLKAELQRFYDNEAELGLTAYALLKDPENPGPYKLDIESEAGQDLKQLFIDSLQQTLSEPPELTLLPLSSSDERSNSIYHYDLEQPAELNVLQQVMRSDNLPLLNLAEVELSGIKALLIEIGNHIGQIVLYKTIAPIQVFSRKSFFLVKAQHRLEKIDDEFLRISPGFQLMQINDQLIVIELQTLEKHFGFHQIIKKEAEKGINAIASLDLLDNPEVLQERIDELAYARRLTKVAKDSAVLQQHVPNDTIIHFCKSFPKLSGKIHFNESEDKIKLDSKQSQDLFIKLLMDNFLTSELTQQHYESLAKNKAEPQAENH